MTSNSSESVDLTKPLDDGKLIIQVMSCFLNVKVQRPYVIITLGEQRHQTSISESRQWNESFEFTVTFHAQLFGTIQLDLYDSYTIYPDKHVGRAEIRLRTLELMPETFDSYYEIWDKKLSTGASSSIGRERAAVNNMGALQARISYRYKTSSSNDPQQDLGKIARTRTTTIPQGATDLLSQEQLDAEFKRHLQFQRERKKSEKRFKKYEENQGLDYPDDSGEEEDLTGSLITISRRRADLVNYGHVSSDDEDEFGEMVAAPLSPQILESKKISEPTSSWSGASDTSQVIKTISKLLATFNQGFELTNVQVLTGFSVLEKFYTDLPRERTWDLVGQLSEIDMAARYWKFSIASYGWKGLNFIGQGNGIFSDAMREHSDAKSIIEYLIIPKEDLLAYEFRSAEAFRPSYFIARDRFTNSIVLSIRGTMSIMDTLTDLVCEYEPWKGGFVHSGMKNSAMWFFRNVVPQLIAYSNEHSATALTIVGHSMGASTAAILTIILTDYIEEFRQKDKGFKLQCFGYAPACGLSLDLAEKYSDIIQSFVFADDVVSKLSYGSMMGVKEMIIASTEAVQDMGLGEIIWSGDLEGEKWQTAFKQIAEVRKRCLDTMDENPRLYVAGKVYQFWLDPTPANESRIVVEKTTAERVCSELVVKKSIIMDHLPTNFDVAFRRARETLMLEGNKSGVLDPHPQQASHQSKFDKVAEMGLKETTDRTGGEGNVLGGKASR